MRLKMDKLNLLMKEFDSAIMNLDKQFQTYWAIPIITDEICLNRIKGHLIDLFEYDVDL